MTPTSLAAFIGLCVLLSLTPGPDTFLVLRYSITNVRSGLGASIGSALGSLGWAALVGFGLAALLEQSAEAYRVLRITGGLYLVFLGVSALIRSRRAGAAASRPAPVPARGQVRSSLFAGLLSCLLNPKVGLFFLAIVPQFLPAHRATFGATMILGGIDAGIALLYLGTLSFVAARAVLWLNRPRVRRTLERTSAAILAALGVGTVALAAADG